MSRDPVEVSLLPDDVESAAAARARGEDFGMSASESGPAANGPLSGLRVVEIGQYIAGPYAAKLLADMGADVVKVESPAGDPMRRWEGTGSGYSPQFAAYNRNKDGVVLDLKSAAGLDALLGLAAGADVLIENFRPGVARRLGFGADVVAQRNPRLVYCSITGFGADGPYATRPAYDSVISAVGGMYSQVIPADALRPAGPAFSDLLAGMSAVQAVLAAVHARHVTGSGQHVEVSMVGAVLDFLTESASTYLQTGATAGPDTRPRRAQAYACVGSDGLAFVVHMSVPEKFWTGLLDVIDRADLAQDPRFATREGRVAHYDELDEILKRETARRPREHWLRELAAHDIPHGPLNRVADLFADPQVAAMDLVTTAPDAAGDEVRMPRHSTVFNGSGRPAYRMAPLLGADTERLLEQQQLSFDDEEVTAS
ncbi:CaiB/BaiF CoA transferase family protein [Pseudonocardia kunmingensis]|uniref:Crotonobetainyl-CoA:carnitine CoA-transferase CaiB-like acyl-CoA transferase n=1 Tax=Pseudonocardia kunmingensis TaxID=630975 RepID=A0A543DQL1_9PSEU|nr:CaiB/BaiF CoA-transferase family protein [Pseudonocardia kunmingensis]TQM11598.1 crotonobetainyl-CoA:carnitine CoA-transferase CaiB-like acyl-CoA transferase [Pseudonocardia kunmingensis]